VLNPAAQATNLPELRSSAWLIPISPRLAYLLFALPVFYYAMPVQGKTLSPVSCQYSPPDLPGRRPKYKLETMEWVKLASVRNDMEADLLGGLLDGEGIPVQKKYPRAGQYLKVFLGPVVEVEVWVPVTREEEARRVLEVFLDANPS